MLNLSPRGWDVYDVITEGYDLPLGAVGPCRLEHPLLQAMEPDALSMSTLDATVCMLVNAGPFHRALCDLSLAHGHPLFGSSANLSLHGTKFRVQDIEPEVLAIADVVIDHGLRKYHSYRASSTLLDMESLRGTAPWVLLRRDRRSDATPLWSNPALPRMTDTPREGTSGFRGALTTFNAW